MKMITMSITSRLLAEKQDTISQCEDSTCLNSDRHCSNITFSIIIYSEIQLIEGSDVLFETQRIRPVSSDNIARPCVTTLSVNVEMLVGNDPNLGIRCHRGGRIQSSCQCIECRFL